MSDKKDIDQILNAIKAPEPSDSLRDRVISLSENAQESKKQNFISTLSQQLKENFAYTLIPVAACLLLFVAIGKFDNSNNNYQINEEDILADINLFDDSEEDEFYSLTI